MLLFLFIPLSLGWLIPGNFSALGIGLMLGVAGASFAIALPLASRWYPPSQQGLVMGIAAAGNIGTVIANLFAPRIAKAYGWHAVLGITMIPLAVVLLAFLLMAKDSPTKPTSMPISCYVTILRKADLWWFCLLYSVTFGAIFQLVPQCFRTEIGVATGLVGSFGAFGGFLLPSLMGEVRLGLHSYAPGWAVLTGIVLIALVVLRILTAVHTDWRNSWTVTSKAESASATVSML